MGRSVTGFRRVERKPRYTVDFWSRLGHSGRMPININTPQETLDALVAAEPPYTREILKIIRRKINAAMVDILRPLSFPSPHHVFTTRAIRVDLLATEFLLDPSKYQPIPPLDFNHLYKIWALTRFTVETSGWKINLINWGPREEWFEFFVSYPSPR